MSAYRVWSATGAAALVAAALSVAAPALAQDEVVGKAAAVNQNSTANGKMLEIGASVIHNERIRTDGRGTLQLLFIDRTTLTVGPNSDVVIDKYVYDPRRRTGQMTVSLGKGLMRFVGGQITHTGTATVKTPPATIGIRGGLVDISTSGRTTTASNAFGVVTFTANSGPGAGSSITIPQGSSGTIGGGGGPTVGATTQQQMNSNNQQFQSKGGQTGGASASTSSSASSVSSRSTITTATITPASAPAAGSTAAGPSSTATASSGTSGGGSTGGTSPASSVTGGPNSPTLNFGPPGAPTPANSAPPPAAAANPPQSTGGDGGGGGGFPCAKCGGPGP